MPSFHQILWKARSVAGVYSDGELANLLGCSRRTVQRHASNGGMRNHEDFITLVRATHPRDPVAAGQLADALGTSLAALGLEDPAARASAADSTRREHADSVVSAAADVLQMPPAAVWPAIAAAFARASEMGASLGGLAAFLARGKGKNRAKAGGKGG